MVSNLSCIGFSNRDGTGLEAVMSRLIDEADLRLACPRGDYAIWRSKTGAQLWFHANPPSAGAATEREIIGLTPFFEGRSSVPMKITGISRRPDDNAFEGAMQGWVAPPSPSPGVQPDEDDELDGSYPMVFDCLDFAVHRAQKLPALCKARVTGFAREIQTFENEAAFDAAQSDAARPMAAQSFFPVGMFSAASLLTASANGGQEQGEHNGPSSHALFTGHVLEHHALTNEVTGAPFHWLVVESLDATYDVVADPAIMSGTPTVGGIVQCACWMFARILGE